MKPKDDHATFSCLTPFRSSSYAGRHMEPDWTGKWGTCEVNDKGVLREDVSHLIMLLITLMLLIYLAHKLQNGWRIHLAAVLCLWQ